MQRIISILLGISLIGLFIAKMRLQNANDALPLTDEYVLASRLFYAVLIFTGLYVIFLSIRKMKK